MADDLLPFRWGQPFRIFDREPPIGGLRHFSEWVSVPDAIEGVPVPIWGPPVDGVVAAQQLGQPRWIKVTANVKVGGALRIPLIDSNNRPFVDPGFPPMVVARHDDSADLNGDIHTDLTSSGVDWRDGFLAINEELINADQMSWSLRRMNNPVAHWELELTYGRLQNFGNPVASGLTMNFDINLFCADVGPPAENQRDFSSDAGVGRIWNLWTVNSGLDHGSAPDNDAINERSLVVGAHDHSAGTFDMYLTDDGTSGGATLFALDKRPAVLVLAHGKHDGYGAGELNGGQPQTAWKPGSHGLGFNYGSFTDPLILRNAQGIALQWGSNAGTGGPHNEAEPNFFFQTILQYDSGPGKWRVRIFDPIGVPAGIGRTRYVFAVGKRP